MKYLKHFNEGVSFETELETSDRVYYNFKADGYIFEVHFSRRVIDYKNTSVWTRNYKTLEKGQRLLKDSNASTVLDTLSNITTDFINKIKPDVILINHLTSNDENSFDFNRRALANYRFLKNKIPQTYSIDYYRIGEYVSADVMCIIKRKDFIFDKEDYDPTQNVRHLPLI